MFSIIATKKNSSKYGINGYCFLLFAFYSATYQTRSFSWYSIWRGLSSSPCQDGSKSSSKRRKDCFSSFANFIKKHELLQMLSLRVGVSRLVGFISILVPLQELHVTIMSRATFLLEPASIICKLSPNIGLNHMIKGHGI